MRKHGIVDQVMRQAVFFPFPGPEPTSSIVPPSAVVFFFLPCRLPSVPLSPSALCSTVPPSAVAPFLLYGCLQPSPADLLFRLACLSFLRQIYCRNFFRRHQLFLFRSVVPTALPFISPADLLQQLPSSVIGCSFPDSNQLSWSDFELCKGLFSATADEVQCRKVRIFFVLVCYASTVLQQPYFPNLVLMRVSESSMAAESSQRAASSSIPRWTYDVFLSFRGEDTRKGFTDHLHAALKQKGLIVFRDDKKLERGENIWLGLLKAIQESEYAVIVISENYASSAWCLDELTEIVKCKGEKRVKVLPIFYKVNPSDVRKQNCNFGITFAEHTANNVDDERRKMWRDALEEVCSISGWDVCGRHEFEVVEEICKRIFDGLSRQMLQINDDLVGIESRIEELMTLLHIGGDDVQFIGICGMGGIGKTTLAEVIYSKVFSRFEAHCFISNVREESQKSRGLVFLQKELISQILGEKEPKICNNFQGRSLIASKVKNKKVFIVLDDVDKENQLEELVGKHDWFGEGSRILITSRDRHLLKRHMNEIYEVAKLNDYDALQLFNLKAFKQRCYEGNYAKFSEDIVKYAGGLPLALKIFGSFLFDNTMDAWKSALERLKESLDGEVFDRLYISFEALGELTKKLFLDIACFFKGKHINNVIHRLKSLGHFPEIDIKVLEEKSLIRIEKGFFEVHDLLQEMSHQIVRREALGNLSRYSRLWRPEDIFYVINHNIGTDAIESIVLDIGLNLGSPNEVETTFEALSKMKKLRMIVIEYGDLQMLSDVDICIFVKSQMECYKDLSKFRLSNELRVMEWWNYLLESLPISFQSNNLVELIMPRSCIKLLWNARKSFGRLKHIDLSFSVNLIEIPDLSGVPNLEKLKLKYCLSLSKVHPSIVSLKKLKFLHIEGLPSYPINLSLPHSISSLSSLEILNLCYCNLSDVALPADLGCLSSLKWLDLTGNKFTTIPRSISGLSKLYSLRLSGCTELQELPNLPIKLKKLYVHYCSSLKGFYLSDFALSSFRLFGIYRSGWLEFGDGWNVWIHGRALLTDLCSHVIASFCDDGKAFKTLHLHVTQADFYKKEVRVESVFAWGRTLGSEIPEWFNQRSTSFLGTVEIHFDYMKHLKFWGCALFIVYEVYEPDSYQTERRKRNGDEHESWNSGMFDWNNLSYPQLVCRLGCDPYPSKFLDGKPLLRERAKLDFSAPKVYPFGLKGVWMFLSFKCFQQVNPACSERDTLRTLIRACKVNEEVKECGARLVCEDDVSEFFNVVSSISPPGFDSEGLENLFSDPLIVHF